MILAITTSCNDIGGSSPEPKWEIKTETKIEYLVRYMNAIGYTNLDLQPLYDSLPQNTKKELSLLGIHDINQLVQDVMLPDSNNGEKNTFKKIDSTVGEKIYLNFEEQIFKNDRYEAISDLLITNYLEKYGNADHITFYDKLIAFARQGEEVKFYKLKKQLEPYLDSFFLEFAENKLKRKLLKKSNLNQP